MTQSTVPECASLMEKQERLKRIYQSAVDILFAVGWQATDAEYARLKNSVEEARVQLEINRLIIGAPGGLHGTPSPGDPITWRAGWL